ncbi:hypothetical protein DB30_07027 [Enhygromyxa salina]|uniref:Uncharacterized protein n=1 Tax=Enhygromyxa salina TaxID=215803 RepID=A0A0C1ZTB7_9BACT|nr:hypothetical protein DB30_07027 [Enhygromyxa salina]
MYPRQAEFADGKLSILAPIGATLLGLRAQKPRVISICRKQRV